MAVVLIMGLMMVLVVPSLGTVRSSVLREAAVSLAGSLELARQRAVVTGVAHRVLVDVEDGSYRIEWWTNQDEALGIGQSAEPVALDLRGMTAIPMAPPLDETVDYRPIPNRFGNATWLDDSLYFEGIDTPEGWLEDGEVGIVFYRDGTTEPAEIVVADDYDGRIYLEIAPLLDRVRIFDEPE